MTIKPLPETPKWLKITRRLYAYLGAGFFVTLFAVYKVPDDVAVKILTWYGFGGVVIQTICDISFKTDNQK